MFWLEQFITSISLSAHIIEEKLKIFGTKYKFEEITQVYLILYLFGDFYCDFGERKHRWLIGVY